MSSRRNLAMLVSYACALGVLGLVLIGVWVTDRPVEDFTKDPVSALDGPAYIGFLSNTGALVWAVALTAALLGWLLSHGTSRRAFFWGGLLTAALLADDVYLLHEVYYSAVGIPEALVLAFYGPLVAAYLWRFRDFLRRHGIAFLPAALVLFAFSAAIDFRYVEEAPFIVEDGAKFLGIVTWAVFFVRACLDEVGQLAGTGSPRAVSSAR